MRKVYRTKAMEHDYYEMLHHIDRGSPTIYEVEYGPEASGILDASGEMIYTYYDKDPIGFTHFK